MKILQVVTLLTPDGAFGGPTRVSLNQCAELISRGHEVTLLAGYAGYASPPGAINNVPLQLFPAQRVIPRFGYSGIVTAGMRRWLNDCVQDFDVVHIHLARDLVSARSAMQVRRHKVPYLTQTHGMIEPTSEFLPSVVDAVWTRRVLKDAECVLYLNAKERANLVALTNANTNLVFLPNGVPPPPAGTRTAAAGAVPEVLFLGRLHPRKRPALFAKAALAMLRSGYQAEFAIVGPPEGEEHVVDEIVRMARDEGFATSQLRREPGVSLKDAYSRMSRASIFVLPAVGEPFGMTIVEALSLSIPVVTANDGGLSAFVQTHDCGLLVKPNSYQDLHEAVAWLLDNPIAAREMGARGARAVAREFGIAKVVDTLEPIYEKSVSRRPLQQ